VRWLVLLPLLGCGATQTVVHVADPMRVSLVEQDDLFTYIPAESPPRAQQELKPGLTAVRGPGGELSLSCAKCRVDDPEASGIWLSADGATEAVDLDARVLASQLHRESVLIPVTAMRNLGRACPFWRCKDRYQVLDAALRTPSTNVTQIIERTTVDPDAPGYIALGAALLPFGVLLLVVPPANAQSRVGNEAAGAAMSTVALALIAFGAAHALPALFPPKNEVVWARER
jgi:hypothetical protein